MPKLFKGSREILGLAGGTQNVKALYRGTQLVYGVAPEPSNIVRIGEHDYPFVKIGNLLWTTKNLYENSIDSYVYNNDQNLEKIIGRLYNYISISSIERISDGFRVPTIEDFSSLLSTVPYDDIKSTDLWETPGTNKSGFNALPGGRFNVYSSVFDNNTSGFFLSKTQDSNNASKFKYALLYNNSYITEYSGFKSDWYFSVRLCKDA